MAGCCEIRIIDSREESIDELDDAKKRRDDDRIKKKAKNSLIALPS